MVYLLKSLFYLLIKGSLKILNDFFPKCGSNDLRKNGTIHNDKAKSECRNRGCQFVINNHKKIVTQVPKNLIDKLLLEKSSLRGIARVVGNHYQLLDYTLISMSLVRNFSYLFPHLYYTTLMQRHIKIRCI